MENICVLNNCTVAYCHIQPPCSEQDYIKMYDAFLRPGISHLKVENISAGRNLIDVFLQTIKNFYQVGCLTLADEQLADYVNDLFQDICLQGDIKDIEVVQNFFLDSFSSDFLWIEATQELQTSIWFNAFNTVITQFGIDQHIPIVILTYE